MGNGEAELQIRLLGGFDVIRDGRAIEPEDWDQQKTASLLKFLLLHRDEIIPADRLIDALYPDSEPDRVRKNLTGRISQLRRLLEPGLERGPDSRYLQTVKDGYRFTMAADGWIDIDDFECELREAESLRQAERWSEAVVRYQRALDLYQGDLLPEDAYEEWTLGPREHFRQLRLRTLEHLAQCRIQLHQYESAIEQLERLLADHPACERAYRLLMRAHHLNGRSDEAHRAFERCAHVLKADLFIDPSPRTTELLDQIRNDAVPPPERSTPHNLPQSIARFVGREREMAELRTLMVEHRLVTLTGVGGMGKTRLAIEAAWTLMDDFSDGVWFVDLGVLEESDEVGPVLLRCLELDPSHRRQPQEIVADYLRRRRVLLILDNCEHLLDACAALATHLLEHCPDLTVLATSRERLGLTGERVWRVPPLRLPSGPDGSPPADCDAVRLYVDRAQAIRSDFRLTTDTTDAVVQICRRLDGLPLAIELAAARLEALSPAEIAARLDERFRLLNQGDRATAERHRSLEAAMAWSHKLLDADEQVLFRRLACFSGTFSLDAVGAVGSDKDRPSAAIADCLANLVRHSLVLPSMEEGDTRYRLLETVREYAWERLVAHDDPDAARDRHLAFHVEMAERVGPTLVHGGDQQALLSDLDKERGNLRAALRWALASGQYRAGLRLMGALRWYWWLRADFTEAYRWYEPLLAQDTGPDDEIKAKALIGAGATANFLARFAEAERYSEQALTIARRLALPRRIGQARVNRGNTAWLQGRNETARRHFQSALAAYQEADDEHGVAGVRLSLGLVTDNAAESRRHYEASLQLYDRLELSSERAGVIHNLGRLDFAEGEIKQARARYRQALALFRDLKHRHGEAMALYNLGRTLEAEGKHRSAGLCHLASLDIRRENGEIAGIGNSLTAVAGLVARVAGDPVAAARIWGAGQGLLQEAGPDDLNPPSIEEMRNKLGRERFDEEAQEGASLPIPEVIAFARRRLCSDHQASTPSCL